MEQDTIGFRLKELRKDSDLTASGLGRLAGLSHAAVSMIENGERKDPSSSLVGKLAAVLGCTSDFLISGKGTRPTREEVLAAVDAARAGSTEDGPEAA